MIDIDFGEQAGGKRSFQFGDDLVRYLNEQRSEWAMHPALPDRQDDHVSSLKRLLLQPWDNLLSEVNSSQVDLSSEAPPRLVQVVATSGESKKLISLGSLAGRIVIGILEEHGATAASGAVKFHQAGPTAQILGGIWFSSKSIYEGKTRLAGLKDSERSAQVSTVFPLKGSAKALGTSLCGN